MATIPIYFSDLKEDAQKRLLEAQGLKTPSEGNYDILTSTCKLHRLPRTNSIQSTVLCKS